MLHNYFKAKELIQKILLILKCTTTSCSFKLLPNVRQKQEKYNTEKKITENSMERYKMDQKMAMINSIIVKGQS